MGTAPQIAADLMWFIPTHGDGRYLASTDGAREVSLGYMRQIAQAADQLGYYGVLLPTGRSCEDAWVVASALAPLTEKLRFLVAVRPGLSEPSMTARMAATLDRLSGGRLLINVVAGGDPAELAGDGVWLDHAARYRATDEYLTVWRRYLSCEKFDFEGAHVRVKDGQLFFPPVQTPHPPLYFGGSSADGQEVAGKHADTYLTWGELPEDVAQKLASAEAAAARHGRSLKFGIRLHVIVRETEEEAWAAADDLIRYVDDAAIERAQQAFAGFDSVGQKRMAALHGGRRDKLVIGPNLWAGVGLVRGGAGTALVGNPQQVADRMREYMDLGIERFIMSGYPHLEECYRFAELVFPLIARRDAGPAVVARNNGPFGEMIANVGAPVLKVSTS